MWGFAISMFFLIVGVGIGIFLVARWLWKIYINNM